jgi:ketosteroid isomerase-like protein
MNRAGTLHLAAVVLLVASCAQPPQEQTKASTDAAPVFTADDATAISGMFTQTVQWLRAGDWKAWSDQYTEDAVLQPPNGPSVVGRAAALAWGQAFPAIEEVDFTNVKVVGEGNIAYGTSDWVLQTKGAPEDKGKQLVVFRRGADGKWGVVAVSFNSNLPPMPGAK